MTLYELTKLPDEVFYRKLEGGEIHADMQRKEVSREHFARAFNVNEKYVEMARELLGDDPVAAQAVLAGGDLREAYKQLTLRQGQVETEARHLRQLTIDRPDLAEKVRTEALSLDEAVRRTSETNAKPPRRDERDVASVC